MILEIINIFQEVLCLRMGVCVRSRKEAFVKRLIDFKHKFCY